MNDTARHIEHLAGLGEIDRAFADLVGRLARGDRLLTATAALVSRERGRGHVCVHLADHAGQVAGRRPDTARRRGPAVRWPGLDSWRQALVSSPLVSSPLVSSPLVSSEPMRVEVAEHGAGEHGVADGGVGQPALTPFVLDAADRLYLTRYFRAERRLASRVRRLVLDAGPIAPRMDDAVEEAGGRADLTALFRQLFPDPDDGSIDHQARAAALALRSPFLVLSGGPGTGKTTTVARILALLLTADPGLRIELAAPTGKAAARLGEAIDGQIARLDLPSILPPEVLARLPRQARTLHRLLGYRPRDDRFRHHADEPLPCDVLVVDEASMVDLLMMDAVCDALAPGARLLLLGDRDQLASVETGFVFGDLALAAGIGTVEETTEEPTEDPEGGGPALVGCGVQLVRSWRFRDQPGIGALAAAIRLGDADRALEVLASSAHDHVEHRNAVTDAPSLLAPVGSAITAYLDAPDPATALARLDAFRILCATRVGPWGTERVVEWVESQLGVLAPSAGIDPTATYYPGRPVLVQQNDYQVGLFNGDLGICWPSEGGLQGHDPDVPLWAHFRGEGPGAPPRRLPLAKLPRHTTAWAMTVHKSQGSEFDTVLLVLPASPEAAKGILTRELLYTGVTRARRHVHLVAPTEVLRAGIERTHRRRSGLVDALSTRDEAAAGTQRA